MNTANKYLKTGLFKTYKKENEKRLPIHPQHLLSLISYNLISSIYLEENYGTNFGIPDEDFIKAGYNIVSRDSLFEMCDMIILPKPVIDDLKQMKDGQILCGWSHAIQQFEIAEIAIAKKLTLIAWEEMHTWNNGEKSLHIFYRNNELAGYAGVIHYLGLQGLDGMYGPRKKVSILGYGSVSKGAIYALQGRGFNNIHVFTKRPVHLIADKNPDVYYNQMINFPETDYLSVISTEGKISHLIEELRSSDIIVNGVLQDVTNPMMFISNIKQANSLKQFTSIIDISCDENMGFYFAKPTSFDDPTFKVGKNITYYSVDHSPSYLWNSATREISLSLIPYIETLMIGEESWSNDCTIMNAIDICSGNIRNEKILKFQNREFNYPHNIIK